MRGPCAMRNLNQPPKRRQPKRAYGVRTGVPPRGETELWPQARFCDRVGESPQGAPASCAEMLDGWRGCRRVPPPLPLHGGLPREHRQRLGVIVGRERAVGCCGGERMPPGGPDGCYPLHHAHPLAGDGGNPERQRLGRRRAQPVGSVGTGQLKLKLDLGGHADIHNRGQADAALALGAGAAARPAGEAVGWAPLRSVGRGRPSAALQQVDQCAAL
mmetsp:Transcript_31392/g.101487  ORF Transcript_31392/g.101487 Transcript_31392/m.101487 type:complete len:216 (+) Transcript_31392:71-718(+)